MSKILIIKQLEFWWNKATEFWKKDKEKSMFYFGHIIHVTHDAFPEGHTIRGDEDIIKTNPVESALLTTDANLEKDKSGAEDYFKLLNYQNCGYVYHFQGYGAQKGNDAHGASDQFFNKEDQKKNDRQRQLQRCAEYFSTQVWRAIVSCLKALTKGDDPKQGICNFNAFLSSLFDKQILAVHDSQKDVTAGGSRQGWHNTKDTTLIPKTFKMGEKDLTYMLPSNLVNAKPWIGTTNNICSYKLTAWAFWSRIVLSIKAEVMYTNPIGKDLNPDPQKVDSPPPKKEGLWSKLKKKFSD